MVDVYYRGHWVLYVSEESLNLTSKTNIILILTNWNLDQNFKLQGKKQFRINSHFTLENTLM